MTVMPDVSRRNLFVSTAGNDAWSGRLPAPTADRSDGPFAGIGQARDAIAGLKRAGRLTGAMTVWIRGGRYPVREPILFGPDDSAPVTYAAYPGETPILDGGRKIENWRVERMGDMTVWVTELPRSAAGEGGYFRSLFVGGERRPRARLPVDGFFRIADVPGGALKGTGLFDGSDRFKAAPGDMRAWRNLTDVDVVVPHYWIAERMPVASWDPASQLVVCSRRSCIKLKGQYEPGWSKYYLDNVFEGLTPGHWYLDRPTGRLTYAPRPGEDPAATAVYAPHARQFLLIAGNSGENRHVDFLRFEGLTFEHTDWTYSSETLGSSKQAEVEVPAVIRLEAARNCAIENCVIRHVGAHAVELADGCAGNRIVGNEMHDLAAGGVHINGSDAHGPPARRTGNNRVTDNHIHHAGAVFHGAVGILSRHAAGTVIAHNHIHDVVYSGISCGWCWDYGEHVARDIRIEKNHVHHLGQDWLGDMAGIYLLGVQPGTIVRGNYVHDIGRGGEAAWGGGGDQATSHVVYEHNVFMRATYACWGLHYGRENMVRNNIFAFGARGNGVSRGEDHRAMTFERNIVVTDGEPAWEGGYKADILKPPFFADLNVYWDLSGKPFGVREKGPGTPSYDFARWQQTGCDTHSVVADPKLRDVRAGDVALAPDSPALTLGFVPIDLSDIGPRPPEKRD